MKKIKILLVIFLLILTTGCTQTLTDSNKKAVKNDITGQTLTKNIICKPENKHTIEYSLKLDSNPEFTASVLVAYARAVYKLYSKKDFGAKTVFDVSPADLSPLTQQELLSKML